MDPEVLETATNTSNNANRIEFYGFGASGSVAADAQHKFFRLQLSSAAYTDPHIQHMSAISLGADYVVVAISQSGQTRALLESVSLAREAGVTVIGVATQKSPLSEHERGTPGLRASVFAHRTPSCNRCVGFGCYSTPQTLVEGSSAEVAEESASPS